jgi:hypothetical protein
VTFRVCNFLLEFNKKLVNYNWRYDWFNKISRISVDLYNCIFITIWIWYAMTNKLPPLIPNRMRWEDNFSVLFTFSKESLWVSSSPFQSGPKSSHATHLSVILNLVVAVLPTCGVSHLFARKKAYNNLMFSCTFPKNNHFCNYPSRLRLASLFLFQENKFWYLYLVIN